MVKKCNVKTNNTVSKQGLTSPLPGGVEKGKIPSAFFPFVRKCISFLDVEGLARISCLWESLILCYAVKNRNDLILTKHLPLGIGSSELVTLYTVPHSRAAGEALTSGLMHSGQVVPAASGILPKSMGPPCLIWKGRAIQNGCPPLFFLFHC